VQDVKVRARLSQMPCNPCGTTEVTTLQHGPPGQAR
jgi:hypothetical protein